MLKPLNPEWLHMIREILGLDQIIICYFLTCRNLLTQNVRFFIPKGSNKQVSAVAASYTRKQLLHFCAFLSILMCANPSLSQPVFALLIVPPFSCFDLKHFPMLLPANAL